MNAKTCRALRRAAREQYNAKENRAGRSYVVGKETSKDFPTGKTDQDGTPQTVRLRVFSLINHPDSYRAVYRSLKKAAR